MRVIGYLPHPHMKITIFETTSRFPVQFEDGSRVQIYRIRRGNGIESLADVKQLIDVEFCNAVSKELLRMADLERRLYDRSTGAAGEEKDDLPSII